MYLLLQRFICGVPLKKTNTFKKRIGHWYRCLVVPPRNHNNWGGAEQEPRKEEVRVSVRLVLLSNGASGAAVSELMETVSANGSLTPRRGHLGLKHGEIDKNGNLNSTQVCHSDAAFTCWKRVAIISRVSSCRTVAPLQVWVSEVKEGETKAK